MRFVSDPTGIQLRDDDGDLLGSLTWHITRTGTFIDSIFVVEHARRQGIATKLWNEARRIHPNLKHSTHQSDAGRAWSASLNQGK